MEITFKLLYEETNNVVKLNDHLKEDSSLSTNITERVVGKLKDYILKFKIHIEVENYVNDGMCCMFNH